jgi:hypothetical protein
VSPGEIGKVILLGLGLLGSLGALLLAKASQVGILQKVVTDVGRGSTLSLVGLAGSALSLNVLQEVVSTTTGSTEEHGVQEDSTGKGRNVSRVSTWRNSEIKERTR